MGRKHKAGRQRLGHIRQRLTRRRRRTPRIRIRIIGKDKE